MSKALVYGQIDRFVNQRVGKSKLHEIKYYVDTQTAEDRAKFTQWAFENDEILRNKKIDSIIDLCYGSGNLTAHILYESNIDTQNLVLNDKNMDDRNNDVAIGNKTDYNFLDSDKFNNKYDLIIFNPQIGGTDTYPEGAVEFKKTVEPIIYHGSFDEYLTNQGISTNELEIEIDEVEKSIMIHSDNLSKSKMKEMFSKVEIFNYYDVFYWSKDTKIEGHKTNIVKFRKTLDKISNDDSVVVFLGERVIYETLFADYSYVIVYLPTEGKELYILTKGSKKTQCYEYKDNKYEVNLSCKKENNSLDNEDLEIGKCIDELEEWTKNESDFLIGSSTQKESVAMKVEDKKEKLINKPLGNLDFLHKNLLLKGVPGTGKSYTIERIIEDKLKLKGEDKKNNVRHINIHSASSNADLMQGIGIESSDGKIEYQEKQGLIFNHIKKALFAPNQPFVLVLEEIQENSLNELIGDLIYLIEEKKRVTVDAGKFEDGKEYAYQAYIEEVLKDENNKHYIEIPYLVDTSTAYRKMVLPSNLYIFCTSNYRDDKKVIEDNLLRRFDVVEIYPQTQEQLGEDVFKSKDISDFLAHLNEEILKKFEDEVHPDRYLIGHANWLDITEDDNDDNQKLFYTALLKVLIEFKEIREVDFDAYTKDIIKNVCTDDDLSDRLKSYLDACDFEYESYKEMVEKLQKEIYSFLK